MTNCVTPDFYNIVEDENSTTIIAKVVLATISTTWLQERSMQDTNKLIITCKHIHEANKIRYLLKKCNNNLDTKFH